MGYAHFMADAVFSRTIGDREVQFRPPTDAQALVLGRLLRLAEGAGEDEAKLAGTIHQLSKVLDILDSMVVNPGDRNWIEQRILDGDLDMSELMDAFRDEVEEAPNRATKRATKKTTAKKTTGRARKTLSNG